RLLKVLSVLFVILMFLNALPMVEHLRSLIGIDGTTGAFQTAKTRKPSPPPFIVKPAAITVSGRQWGQSTCYIGASEGSSRYDIGDLLDLGINTYHIYGGMSRWEAHNDSSVYGTPTITQIKANPNIINWKWWDTAMTAPPDGSDYWWEPAPHWQGNARTLLSSLQANHIRIILVLRNRDDQHQPGWAPDPPKTTADWNEWW